MNEKNKTKILLGVVSVLVIAIIAICGVQIKEQNELIDKIKTIMNSKEPKVIYLARPSCYYCNLLEPITDSLEEEYDLEYTSINTDEISESQLNKILKLFGVDSSNFGTPYLVIVKDGKVVKEQAGFADEDVIFEFFQDGGVISEDEKLLINYLDSDEVKQITNDSQDAVLLLGEIGTETLTSAKEEVKEIIEDNNIEIKYFDITNVTDETEQTEILNNLGYEEELNTPVLLVIENGKVKATESEIDNYEEFLKTNGYIK